MKKIEKQLFSTLTRGQQEVWAIAVKGKCRPVIVDNKQKTRKELRKVKCSHKGCGKNALVFVSKKKQVFAVCSSKHVTLL
jgi:hypothetical protein